MRIGFIGLGNIGGPCARHILAAGHELTVADLDPAACRRLGDAGAREARNPASVSQVSEAIFLSLPTPEASRAVVTGPDGILSAGPPGLVVVDLSTNSVGVTAELFDACAAEGVDYLDCPVSGGSMGAEAGSLTLMSSGDALEDEAGFTVPLPPKED